MKIILTAFMVMSAGTLSAYEKRVLSEGMSMADVRALAGNPNQVIQISANEHGWGAGQEWHYFRRIGTIGAEVKKLSFGYGFLDKSKDLKLEIAGFETANEEWRVIYEPEILRPVTGFKERFLTPDITLSEVSIRLKGQGHVERAGFLLEFSYVNNLKEPLPRINFMVEMIDDPDAAVSNERASTIQGFTSLPGVSYSRSGLIWLPMSKPGQISVPKHLRIKAFKSEGTALSLGNSLYEISPR